MLQQLLALFQHDGWQSTHDGKVSMYVSVRARSTVTPLTPTPILLGSAKPSICLTDAYHRSSSFLGLNLGFSLAKMA